MKVTYHYHRLPLNRDGRWRTTDDFTTSSFQFPLFSTALWDLANSRPVYLSCLPVLLKKSRVVLILVLC